VGKKTGSVNAKRATSQRSTAAPARASELHQDSPLFLALTAVGIVFGDIGTSPLYTLAVTLAATGHALPTAADVLGIISLIFWALMAMVSLKYVVLVLRADNDGEGGILALLALVDGERIMNCWASQQRRCFTATASSRRPSPCCPPSRALSWLRLALIISSCR
jgi:K+ transporter